MNNSKPARQNSYNVHPHRLLASNMSQQVERVLVFLRFIIIIASGTGILLNLDWFRNVKYLPALLAALLIYLCFTLWSYLHPNHDHAISPPNFPYLNLFIDAGALAVGLIILGGIVSPFFYLVLLSMVTYALYASSQGQSITILLYSTLALLINYITANNPFQILPANTSASDTLFVHLALVITGGIISLYLARYLNEQQRLIHEQGITDDMLKSIGGETSAQLLDNISTFITQHAQLHTYAIFLQERPYSAGIDAVSPLTLIRRSKNITLPDGSSSPVYIPLDIIRRLVVGDYNDGYALFRFDKSGKITSALLPSAADRDTLASCIVASLPGNYYWRAIVAMLKDGQVYGAFTVAWQSHQHPDAWQMQALSRIARQAAANLEIIHLNTQIQLQIAELRTLDDVGRAITAKLDFDATLRTILLWIKQLVGFDLGAIYLLQPESKILFLRHRSGTSNLPIRERYRLWEGTIGNIAANNNPLLIASIAKQTRGVSGEFGTYGSLLGIPLLLDDRGIGVLMIYSSKPDFYGEHELHLLQPVGSTAAVAIENSKLYAQVQEQLQSLQAAHTELQETYTELQRTYTDLARSDELKSTLIRNVTHELRTPVTLIKGFTQILQTQNTLDETTRQNIVQKIITSADKLDFIVGTLIDFSELQSKNLALNCSSLSLAAILEELVMLWNEKTPGHRIQLQVAADFPYAISFDEARIRTACNHLIDNAVKFSRAGSTILVQAGLMAPKSNTGSSNIIPISPTLIASSAYALTDEQPRYNTAADASRQQAQYIFVSISDQGIGIPKEKQAEIFQPFIQIDGSATRKYGGTGMGLALVKQIVQVHGGTLHLRSTPNKGSTFWFTLPYTQQLTNKVAE